MTDSNPLRNLPSVDRLVNDLEGTALPRPLVVDIARTALALARELVASGRSADVPRLASDMLAGLLRSRTHRVINASGVLLHTNLGRAPVSETAAAAAQQAAAAYTNLELDLDTGERGGRGRYLTALLGALTGAEDALVVNNNAAAVLLALAATSSGKAVPVSRGELIEIGGSYRLPLVMEAGGARLVEVGTTNRTRAGDYVTALQVHDCGAVLRVHPSNYRITGFVQETPVEELARLAHGAGVPLIHDVGSGLLDATVPWLEGPRPDWLADEPGVRQSIEAGADLVTFSGDKLLGGPQAGIIVGSKEAVGRLRRHPLARALRIDAMTDAALSATLEAYADGRADEIPFWAMVTLDPSHLRRRATSMARELGGVVTEGAAVIGAGSVPGSELPGPQVTLEGEDHLHGRLLTATRPVLTRRVEKDLIIDLRAVAEPDDRVIVEVVRDCR